MRTLALLLIIFAAGCPNPNTYTTARTLPAGRMQLVVAPEAYGGLEEDTINDTGTTVDAFVTAPTIGARIGVSDSVDIGARLPNLGSVAADTKINLYRGKIDIALDPGVQWFRANFEDTTSGNSSDYSHYDNIFYFQAPLLVDYNLSRSVSLVASPGATLAYSTQDGQSFMGQLGLGMDFRVTPWLSVFPQVTFLSGFSGNDDRMFVGGIGLSYGSQPTFDDLDGSGELQYTARR